MQFSAVPQLTGADCVWLLSTVLCKKVQRSACNNRSSYSDWCLCLSCFHPRRSLLTAYWRAQTCQTTCLFSSSLHKVLLDQFLCLLCTFCSEYFPTASPCPSVFLSDICYISSLSAPSFAPLPPLFLRVSAQCPVEEESRLGPSSVSGRVAPQLAACPTRDLTLPGLATLSSAPLPPLALHKAPARPQYRKVNSCQRKDLTCPLACDSHIISWLDLEQRWFQARWTL